MGTQWRIGNDVYEAAAETDKEQSRTQFLNIVDIKVNYNKMI